jgi:hypothetical protein
MVYKFKTGLTAFNQTMPIRDQSRRPQGGNIMKKILLVAAVAAVVMVMVGSAFAVQQSANVNISATVGATACKAINAGSLSLIVSDVTATTTPVQSTGAATTIQCQNNQAATVTAESLNTPGVVNSGTLNAVLLNGGETLPYTLTFTTAIVGSGYGGPGRDKTLVAATAAQTTPTGIESAGIYTDVVTITVNY